jgi:hypothetical protein
MSLNVDLFWLGLLLTTLQYVLEYVSINTLSKHFDLVRSSQIITELLARVLSFHDIIRFRNCYNYFTTKDDHSVTREKVNSPFYLCVLLSMRDKVGNL